MNSAVSSAERIHSFVFLLRLTKVLLAMNAVVLAVAAISCSTSPSHVSTPVKNKKGDEYSIKDRKNGFVVAGHYSEYQFVRNSKKAFNGCMGLINHAAVNYADSKGKEVEVPTWTEIEIIDHGRDIITAVMNVNCRYEYRFKTNLGKADIVDSLKDLKQLRDEGELSDTQYERAKESLLRSENP